MRREHVDIIFANDLKALREFTKDCRTDMHEPDEQGITSAVVRGRKFDNAGFDHEKKLVLRNTDTGKTFEINLCDLIALARR